MEQGQALTGYGQMISNAIADGWNHMTSLLFRQFSLGRWITLAFLAWMAKLGAGGGGSFNSLGNFGSGGTGAGAEAMQGVAGWIQANLPLVIIIATVGGVIAMGIWVLCLWISSRGKFMFLNSVVCNVTKVREPWNRFRQVGNSLFLWRLTFWIIALLAFAVVAGIFGGALAALQQQTALMVIVVAICAVLFILLLLTVTVILTLLQDFIIPLMYRYEMRAWSAWGYGMNLITTHWKGFLLFLLVRVAAAIGLGIAAAVFVGVVGLLTCCTAWLLMVIPVVGGVLAMALTLPVPVFMRLFSVYFLQQFHPDYRMTALAE
ncbi:MAG: hypothetical protein R6V56_04630 [Lentisphaeria bacterium]